MVRACPVLLRRVFALASIPAEHSPISCRSPSNPAVGLLRGVNRILAACGASADNVVGLAHGTTVATNALLQGEINSLGLIVNSGFKHILEIARQSVPEGYGNSYFWVMPDCIVPLQFVREVTGR